MTDTIRPPVAPPRTVRRNAALQAAILAHARHTAPSAWSTWLAAYIVAISRMNPLDATESLAGLADALRTLGLDRPQDGIR